MEQLSALDAIFAYTETQSTPMHIGQILIYDPSTAPDGKVGFKDILGYIESRLDGARIFRQKLVRVPLDLDHPYWVDDENFDLEYHVRHIALPHPGDWRQLCIQAARIYARPLDMERPLWEFTVIEGLDNVKGYPKGSFAVLQKFHHAAVDGQSGLAMTMALHDFDAKMKRRKFDSIYDPEPDPAPLNLLAKAHVNNITNPVRGLKNLQNLIPISRRMREFRRQNKQRSDAKTRPPKTRFNKKISSHRVFDADGFSLADIKTIRNAFPGVTVNDVMLTVVGGTMRRYLKAKGELPDETLKAGAPVSVRDDNSKAAGGNQVSMMQVGLGTHLSDPGKRLEFVHAETSRSKVMNEALGARTIMDLTGALPAGLTAASTKLALRMGLAQTMNPQINTVVTNVPGPPVTMYFTGAKMVAGYGMGLVSDGLGIFHVVGSYDGRVVLTVLADRNMLPDPDFYAKGIAKSFDALMKAAAKRLKKQKTPKKAAAKKAATRKSAPKTARAKRPVKRRRTPSAAKVGVRRKKSA